MHDILRCGCPQWVDTAFHVSGVRHCVTEHWRHVAVSIVVGIMVGGYLVASVGPMLAGATKNVVVAFGRAVLWLERRFSGKEDGR